MLNEQNPQSNPSADNSQAFTNGLVAGCSGCLVAILVPIIGLMGGCLAGGYAYEWYYADQMAETAQRDPYLQISWIFNGAALGLFSGIVIAMMGWAIAMMRNPEKK